MEVVYVQTVILSRVRIGLLEMWTEHECRKDIVPIHWFGRGVMEALVGGYVAYCFYALCRGVFFLCNPCDLVIFWMPNGYGYGSRLGPV